MRDWEERKVAHVRRRYFLDRTRHESNLSLTFIDGRRIRKAERKLNALKRHSFAVNLSVQTDLDDDCDRRIEGKRRWRDVCERCARGLRLKTCVASTEPIWRARPALVQQPLIIHVHWTSCNLVHVTHERSTANIFHFFNWSAIFTGFVSQNPESKYLIKTQPTHPVSSPRKRKINY